VIVKQPGCHGIGGGDITIFVCDRGMTPKVECSSCGRIAKFYCDFPLKGAKQGQLCCRPLCSECAVVFTEDECSQQFCQPHARLNEKKRSFAREKNKKISAG
jgi:hypothetical protein